MTDSQMAMLLSSIWLAGLTGPRFACAMGFVFLFFAFYLRWFK
jgi:hypothetical protein